MLARPSKATSKTPSFLSAATLCGDGAGAVGLRQYALQTKQTVYVGILDGGGGIR
jgi:hypothetical protein